MIYHIDGLKIHSNLFKTDEMSLMAKVWCVITILAIVAVLQATVHMDVKYLIESILVLAVIGWSNWIN